MRDGRPHPPARVEDFEILPGVAAALARLREAGFALIVVTNQPDIARGIQRREVVDAIHAVLAAQAPVDAVYVCPHDDRDLCACRKPEPGLLLEGAREHDIDLARSFMVGDRWRDVEAGRRAGCTTIFVDCGYAERRAITPDATVASLDEAAQWILSRCDDGAP